MVVMVATNFRIQRQRDFLILENLHPTFAELRLIELIRPRSTWMTLVAPSTSWCRSATRRPSSSASLPTSFSAPRHRRVQDRQEFGNMRHIKDDFNVPKGRPPVLRDRVRPTSRTTRPPSISRSTSSLSSRSASTPSRSTGSCSRRTAVLKPSHSGGRELCQGTDPGQENHTVGPTAQEPQVQPTKFMT